MPRSSPSTSAPRANTPSVEVVELDRDPAPTFAPSFDSRPNRWAVLFGILVVALLGLSLLPSAEIEPVSADATLPDPALATTVVGNRPRQIAFISDERFPMRAVTGAKGFASLTGPVAFDSRWWMIGNWPDPTSSAAILRSDDGRSWESVGWIEADSGQSIRVDQLRVFEDALVAVGTQGTSVGPSFLSTLAGNVTLWRSGDGVRWAYELVHESESHIAFEGIRLVFSGQSVLVQASAVSSTRAESAERLPSHVIPPLEAGRFGVSSHGFRLLVHGPLGIEVAGAQITSITLGSSIRLFRLDSVTEWSEIDVGFELSGDIVAVPDGGFAVIGGGIAYTSAYGTSWLKTTRVDADYQQWGERVLGLQVSRNLAIDIISVDEQTSIQLPPEMHGCSIVASDEFLAADCRTEPAVARRVVEWNDKELSLAALNSLYLTDPSASARQFQLEGGGTYDPVTDTIVLTDTEGTNEAFPVDVLSQLEQSPASYRHDVLLSRDGLSWLPGQSALWSNEVKLLGSVENGFLFATRSAQPGSPLIVSVGDL